MAIKLKKFSEQEQASYLINSPRGRFIIGQALYLAIEALEKVEAPHREESNISDMKCLQTIFFPYEIVAQTKVVLAPLSKIEPLEIPEELKGGCVG